MRLLCVNMLLKMSNLLILLIKYCYLDSFFLQKMSCFARLWVIVSWYFGVLRVFFTGVFAFLFIRCFCWCFCAFLLCFLSFLLLSWDSIFLFLYVFYWNVAKMCKYSLVSKNIAKIAVIFSFSGGLCCDFGWFCING